MDMDILYKDNFVYKSWFDLIIVTKCFGLGTADIQSS